MIPTSSSTPFAITHSTRPSCVYDKRRCDRSLMEQRTLTVSRPIVAVDELNFFRWGRIAGKVLVTNDAGDWIFLSENDFSDLLGGRVGESHPRFQSLQSKGFLRNGLDLDDFARRLARRNRHVAQGPHVHVVVVTE